MSPWPVAVDVEATPMGPLSRMSWSYVHDFVDGCRRMKVLSREIGNNVFFNVMARFDSNTYISVHPPCVLCGRVCCCLHPAIQFVQVAKAHMDLDQWDDSLVAFKKARLVRHGEKTRRGTRDA